MKQNFKLPFQSKAEVVNNLVIEISNDEISMLVYSTFPFSVNGYYNYVNCDFKNQQQVKKSLSELFNSLSLTKEIFEKVKVFYNFSESTLLPQQFFNESDKQAVVELMFGEKQQSTCLSEKTQLNDIVNVYRVPTEIDQFFKDEFSLSSFAHSSSSQMQHSTPNLFYCLVYDTQLKIVLQYDSKFLNVVYQNYTSVEDVSYHLLNICERYKLPADTLEIVLAGKIELGSNLYNEIHKYIYKSQIIEPTNNVQFDVVMTGMQIHYFEHLINLAKCVL